MIRYYTKLFTWGFYTTCYLHVRVTEWYASSLCESPLGACGETTVQCSTLNRPESTRCNDLDLGVCGPMTHHHDYLTLGCCKESINKIYSPGWLYISPIRTDWEVKSDVFSS